MVSGLVLLWALNRKKGETRVHDILDSSILSLDPPSPRFPPHFPMYHNRTRPQDYPRIRGCLGIFWISVLFSRLSLICSHFLLRISAGKFPIIATAPADWCVTSQQPADGPDNGKQRDECGYWLLAPIIWDNKIVPPCRSDVTGVYTSPSPHLVGIDNLSGLGGIEIRIFTYPLADFFIILVPRLNNCCVIYILIICLSPS